MATAKNARPPQRPPGAVTGSVRLDARLSSWQEIADELGITRQRVELIGKRAMKKVQQRLAERGVTRETLSEWVR